MIIRKNQTNKPDVALAILIKGICYYEQKINSLKTLLKQDEDIIQKCWNILTKTNIITSKDIVRFFCSNLRAIKAKSCDYIFKRIGDSRQISMEDLEAFLCQKVLIKTSLNQSRLREEHQIKETLIDLFETISKLYQTYFYAQQDIINKYNIQPNQAYKILSDKDQNVTQTSLQRVMERNNFKFNQDDYALLCLSFFKNEKSFLTYEEVEEILYGSGPKTDKTEKSPEIHYNGQKLQNSRQSNNLTYSFYNRNNQIDDHQQMISVIPSLENTDHQNKILGTFKNFDQTDEHLSQQQQKNTSPSGSRLQTENFKQFFQEQNPTIQNLLNQVNSKREISDSTPLQMSNWQEPKLTQFSKNLESSLEKEGKRSDLLSSPIKTENDNREFCFKFVQDQKQIQPMFSPTGSDLLGNRIQSSTQRKLKYSKNYFSGEPRLKISQIDKQDYKLNDKTEKDQKKIQTSKNHITEKEQKFIVGYQVDNKEQFTKSMYELKNKNHISKVNSSESFARQSERKNQCYIF